ncbi:uncharacterized protein LOC113859829 [Abrus precatorius]|uniref:Uncharacterized protein LOC113859829 n=1 Tax=Abrus precatorius TaxID=3816 RepID=A0A8B8L0Z0_ABRPR|nr:uncharacterized protein LOC113859829 [Abrus precatorius]
MDLIKYIFEKPVLTRRIARLQVLLSEYDILYVTQKAIKDSVVVDFLAHQPINDYRSIQYEFPDKNIMTLFNENESLAKDEWVMMFDGASITLGHEIDAILISPEKQYISITAGLSFDCTNNVAEYEACAMGIQAAIESKIKILKHIPCEENQLADALTTLSSMFVVSQKEDMSFIKLQQLYHPAYCQMVEEEFDEYLLNAAENDKRTLRRLAMNFFLNGNVLYKRNHDMVLLRCVDASEAQKIIEEIHKGSFKTHANRHAMAKKILRAGYYWLTMKTYAENINVPPTNLNVLSSPWPFLIWRIDVLGPTEPKASNGHRFILVAIDYFTKWFEAVSYASVTRNVVVRFIKKDLICRYGLPIRTSTGATPYSLVYRIEAILPIEVEIPSLRVIMGTRLEEAEWVQSCFDQLNFIEEKRLNALSRSTIPAKDKEHF